MHYEKVKLNKTGFIGINSPEGATACSPVALAPGCDASRFASPEGATDIFVDDLVLSPLRGWENGERRKPGAKATRLHALAPSGPEDFREGALPLPPFGGLPKASRYAGGRLLKPMRTIWMPMRLKVKSLAGSDNENRPGCHERLLCIGWHR